MIPALIYVMNERFCPKCQTDKPETSFYLRGPKRPTNYSGYCKSCTQRNTSERQQRVGFERKLAVVQSLGGCCTNCNYNKNLSALVFHHIDPSTKSFELDKRTFSNNNIDLIMSEVKKCKLLCHNCHAEEHNPTQALTNCATGAKSRA